MAIKAIGIDLGKTVFVAAALDGQGRLVAPAKRHARTRLIAWLANLPPCLVGMEASSGAHHLARTLQAQGHDVRLLPGQAVKPFRGAMKNDAADALAIAEAVRRPRLRTVPIKSEAQLDVQAIHRVRTQLLRERTALINQVRGLLRERGIAVAQGPHRLAKALIEVPGAPAGISATLRMLLTRRRTAWRRLDAEIGELDRLLVAHARTDARCRRLMTIPGLGPITATALVAAVDDGQAFDRARDLAAWLGLVPRQHSTGGRARLRGIAKGGNRYLRTLLVHGARALRRSRHARSSSPGSGRLGAWLAALETRAHSNKVTVALANKLARIAWAVLAKKEDYRALPA
jgi:transposase